MKVEVMVIAHVDVDMQVHAVLCSHFILRKAEIGCVRRLVLESVG
jgi:hypothetical protein